MEQNIDNDEDLLSLSEAAQLFNVEVPRLLELAARERQIKKVTAVNMAMISKTEMQRLGYVPQSAVTTEKEIAAQHGHSISFPKSVPTSVALLFQTPK